MPNKIYVAEIDYKYFKEYLRGIKKCEDGDYIKFQYEYFDNPNDNKDVEYSIKWKILEINSEPFRKNNYKKITGINTSSAMAMNMSGWYDDDETSEEEEEEEKEETEEEKRVRKIMEEEAERRSKFEKENGKIQQFGINKDLFFKLNPWMMGEPGQKNYVVKENFDDSFYTTKQDWGEEIGIQNDVTPDIPYGETGLDGKTIQGADNVSDYDEKNEKLLKSKCLIEEEEETDLEIYNRVCADRMKLYRENKKLKEEIKALKFENDRLTEKYYYQESGVCLPANIWDGLDILLTNEEPEALGYTNDKKYLEDKNIPYTTINIYWSKDMETAELNEMED